MQIQSDSLSQNRPRAGRTILVLASLGLLLAVVGATFWFQELRYLRPTPRPAGLPEVKFDTTVPLASLLPVLGKAGDQRPIFLHFFNADCPCSRFNVDHLTELYRLHGKEARFVAVVQATGDAAELAAVRTRAERTFGGMPVVIDEGGSIAEACGVYSTPQAAVFSPRHALLYRGNYNVSRYCDDPATAFAQVALEAALAGKPVPAMPPAATVAYGCELPAFTAQKRTLPATL